MIHIKCSNFILCKQFVNKNINNSYCKDCLFYFNYTLEFLYTASQNTKDTVSQNRVIPSCPVCLSDDKALYVKQKNCNHFICIGCFYDIYFNKDFFNKMPINPVFKLKKSWNLFIYNSKYFRIKNKFTDPFLFSLDDFNYELFDILLEKYKHLIPNIFKRNFEELIKFQIKKNNYIYDYKKKQSEKIQLIKKCPFCRNNELIK